MKISELGIPVRSVSWVRLHAGQGAAGNPVVCVTMSQQADNFFILRIDPETGQCSQFLSSVPESNYATATRMSSDGHLYIGAAHAGHLLRFDPCGDEIEDLGPIHPGAAIFPCRIDEDSSGRLWIGSYGTADLTAYDPKRNEFTHYGRMDDVDMYNYPYVNTDDTVACLIKATRPHVVVFDPHTGKRTPIGPGAGQGGGRVEIVRAANGRLYIDSREGSFLISGTEATPVSNLPSAEPEATLPDGSEIRFADGENLIFQKFEVRAPDGETRIFKVSFEAAGSRIFHLAAGPDGCIYGSSMLPLHLFRYDPETEELIDFGKCSEAAGEVYSMAHDKRKLYIASYPEARLSVYDPTLPYNYGTEPGSNPRDLGRMDEISYRPRSAIAGPLGRIWTASRPDYGLWGGPLASYDPATGNKKSYDRIAGDASCYTLAHLAEEDLLAIGTSIDAGTGTVPKAGTAVLLLWDYSKEEKVWEGSLPDPVFMINALQRGADRYLYGTAWIKDGKSKLFVFDPRSRTFAKEIPLPRGKPLDLGLLLGPDNAIYGFTSSCLYRLVPGSSRTEVILREEDTFTTPGPIMGTKIYFATGHRLRAIELL